MRIARAQAKCVSPWLRPRILLCALLAPWPACAAPLETDIVALQHDWEVIRYQTPAFEREKRYEALAARARALSAANPQRSEPLVWEGIIVSSWAEAKGGLGALRLVNRAKALYESAIRIDGGALDGAALNSLGALYYKAPAWPIGFRDTDKARELLLQALRINPDGIEANYCYGEFLVRTGHTAEAVPYLERAIAAPPRPGHQVGDTGRRAEARALLGQVRTAR